jgi:hypothetical protein
MLLSALRKASVDAQNVVNEFHEQQRVSEIARVGLQPDPPTFADGRNLSELDPV